MPRIPMPGFWTTVAVLAIVVIVSFATAITLHVVKKRRITSASLIQESQAPKQTATTSKPSPAAAAATPTPSPTLAPNAAPSPSPAVAASTTQDGLEKTIASVRPNDGKPGSGGAQAEPSPTPTAAQATSPALPLPSPLPPGAESSEKNHEYATLPSAPMNRDAGIIDNSAHLPKTSQRAFERGELPQDLVYSDPNRLILYPLHGQVGNLRVTMSACSYVGVKRINCGGFITNIGPEPKEIILKDSTATDGLGKRLKISTFGNHLRFSGGNQRATLAPNARTAIEIEILDDGPPVNSLESLEIKVNWENTYVIYTFSGNDGFPKIPVMRD